MMVSTTKTGDKTFIPAVLVLMTLLLCSGCYGKKDYTGDYPELYTVAIHSIPGNQGYDEHPEFFYSSGVEVLGEDNYGRILFFYYEYKMCAILVCQKADRDYAYFYPDYNFIAASKQKDPSVPEDYFTSDEIEALKEINDWNREPDESKYIRARITTTKSNGPVKDKTVMEFYTEILGSDVSTRTRSGVKYLTTDEYGRSIYLGYGTYGSSRVVCLLFNPDGTYDATNGALEITRDELYGCQDRLKEFKKLNGWNTP